MGTHAQKMTNLDYLKVYDSVLLNNCSVEKVSLEYSKFPSFPMNPNNLF